MPMMRMHFANIGKAAVSRSATGHLDAATPMRSNSRPRRRAFLGSAASSLIALVYHLVLPDPAIADERRTNRIRVEYVAPSNREHQELYELLKQRQALERLQEIFSPFRLPAELTLRTIGCIGVSHFWYLESVVSVCYEYMAEIYAFIPKETTASRITPADAALGQFFYVFAHEMAHAVYDVLKVPVLGMEEDAADFFGLHHAAIRPGSSPQTDYWGGLRRRPLSAESDRHHTACSLLRFP